MVVEYDQSENDSLKTDGELRDSSKTYNKLDECPCVTYSLQTIESGEMSKWWSEGFLLARIGYKKKPTALQLALKI